MTDADPEPDYPPLNTLETGLKCRCPRCGKGPVFDGFLKLREGCPVCGLSYSFADPADGPAFFGMSAIGVLAMAGMMALEFSLHPPIWIHLVVTLPLTVLACVAILRPLKGWLISEQYVHKAAPPEFSSVGAHGEGSPWKSRRGHN